VTIRKIRSGRGHKYVDSEGNRVPGVTTIIGEALAKPALIDWAARTTAEHAIDNWDRLSCVTPSMRLTELKGARWKKTSEASVKGVKVHALADRMVRGEVVEAPPHLVPYLKGYANWLDATGVEAVMTETMVWDPIIGYCGTFDALLRWPDGRLELADIKTGAGIYLETALQLAAYIAAPLVIIDGQAIAQLDDFTGAAIHVTTEGTNHMPVDAGEQALNAFLACKTLYDWKHGDDPIGPATVVGTQPRWRVVEDGVLDENDRGDW
jgi:hypothetical protein